MRCAIARTRLRTRLKHWRRAKKSPPCLIKKASRCVADRTSKATTFLIIFCETPRSYEKIMCIYLLFFDSMVKIVFSKAATGGVLCKKMFLKFKKFTGKYKARISFLINLQAPLTSLLILT